jgi:hypothetical protein
MGSEFLKDDKEYADRVGGLGSDANRLAGISNPTNKKNLNLFD